MTTLVLLKRANGECALYSAAGDLAEVHPAPITEDDIGLPFEVREWGDEPFPKKVGNSL